MAPDARAMLRASRDARKITHPHASYAAGKLSCSLCRVVVKAEVQWDSHIRSQQHMERVKASTRSDAGLPNRKRKAEANDDPEQDEAKRSKLGPSNVETRLKTPEASEAVEEAQTQPAEVTDPVQQETIGDTLDENEWDAFERDLQQLKSEEAKGPSGQSLSAVTSGAFISAAPMTAEELAAKAREEQSHQQRGRREEELEAEGEDAAARIDEEEEEMQRLQTRMQQLRDRREALRKLAPQPDTVSNQQSNTKTDTGAQAGDPETSDGGDSDSADDDQDEEDEWANFGTHR